MFSKDESYLSPLLNFLVLFLDFPLLDCLSGTPPPKGWTKSRQSWNSFCFSAELKRVEGFLSVQEKEALKTERRRENHPLDSSQEPLVSVIIPTYNRPDLLVNRSVPSVLNQTHKNLELIIVGDQCSSRTEELLKTIDDRRIKFINLPQRGNYPEMPFFRWLVAGVTPANRGLLESKGEWIAHLDDDDEFSPDHIESLLCEASAKNLEMVYGKVRSENPDGSWVELGSSPLEGGSICRSAALYKGYLKGFLYDLNSWDKAEPADYDLWRRMKRAGVRIGFLNYIVGVHYKERTNIKKTC